MIERLFDKLPPLKKRKIMTYVVNMLVLHENGHLLYTDFRTFRYIYNILKYYHSSLIANVFKLIFNILEDRRIENLLLRDYFGFYQLMKTANSFLYQVLNDSKTVIETISNSPKVFNVLSKIFDLANFIWEITSDKKIFVGELINRYSDDSVKFIKEFLDFLTIIAVAIKSRNKKSTIRVAYAITMKILNLLRDELDVINLKIDLYYYVILLSIELFKSETDRRYNLNQVIASAGKGNNSIIMPKESYNYYKKVIDIYKDEIIKLDEIIKMFLKKWKESRSTVGDILEDRIIDAYLWSITRDEPRPKAFRGIRYRYRELDIILHLDQSGSTDLPIGKEKIGELIMNSAIIFSKAVETLLNNNIIKLGISAFGDHLKIIKRVDWPLNMGYFNPDIGGGTEIYSSLLQYLSYEVNKLRKGVPLLIIIFTDSYNFPNDNNNVKLIKKLLKKKSKEYYLYALVSARGLDKEFIKTVDDYDVLIDIHNLPEKFIKVMFKAFEHFAYKYYYG